MLPHLNFNLVECFAVVHTNHGPNHLRQNDHVSQVGLDHLWFLHGRSLLLCLTQTLQKGLLLATQTTVKPPPLACTVELHKLLTEMKREDSKVNNGGKKTPGSFTYAHYNCHYPVMYRVIWKNRNTSKVYITCMTILVIFNESINLNGTEVNQRHYY